MAIGTAAATRRIGPSVTYRGRVETGWIDVNRHMNVSSYDRVFDLAETAFFAEFGVEDNLIARTQMSFFRLERLVRYERELLPGDILHVHSQIIWTDFRRIHHFHELWNPGTNERAAFVDAISIHVDLRRRRSTEIALPDVRIPLERLVLAHADLPKPEGVLDRINGRRAQ